MNRKISVVINTFNAERYLKEVLESLSGFDEIVICDMESTDDTLEIAKEFGCRTVTFPKGNNRICEPARNFAIRSASFDWVLVVDADEVVTPELQDYLYRRISEKDFRSAIAIPRKNMFLGKYTTASGDYQLRFFLKTKCDWPATIHSRPDIDGPVECIPSKRKELYLLHLDDPCLSHRMEKINRYTDYEVDKRICKNYGIAKMIFRPMWFFLRNYFFNKGFLDGRRGLVRSYFVMIYQIVFMSKIYEQRIR